jgi:hypothetical protein
VFLFHLKLVGPVFVLALFAEKFERIEWFIAAVFATALPPSIPP